MNFIKAQNLFVAFCAGLVAAMDASGAIPQPARGAPKATSRNRRLEGKMGRIMPGSKIKVGDRLSYGRLLRILRVR